jgi:hypothetical protein
MHGPYNIKNIPVFILRKTYIQFYGISFIPPSKQSAYMDA